MKRKNAITALSLCTVLAVGGCAGRNTTELISIPNEETAAIGYDTVLVGKGDIEPILDLMIQSGEVEKTNYYINETYLTVEDLAVSVGDHVEAGDLLVKFESEQLEKDVKRYRDDYEKKKLLLEHVKNKSLMDKDTEENRKDYSLEINRLTDDIELARIYLAEQEANLAKRKIVAERTGTVSYIDKSILAGYANANRNLLTVGYGGGDFYAETEDDYEFVPGDVYQAENSFVKIDMMVVNTEPTEKGQKITFCAVNPEEADNSGDYFTMSIKKDILNDVVYVSQDAIHTKDGATFVYVMDMNDFRKVAYVTVSSYVDGYAIISSGLSGGEEVTLK